MVDNDSSSVLTSQQWITEVKIRDANFAIETFCVISFLYIKQLPKKEHIRCYEYSNRDKKNAAYKNL